MRRPVTYQFAAQVLGVLCQFGSMILLARMAGAAGQGEMSLFQNFAALSVLLLSLGLPPAILHGLAAGKLDRASFLPVLARYFLLPAAGFFALYSLLRESSLLRPLLPEFLFGKPAALLAGIYAIMLLANQYVQSGLQALRRFRSAAFHSLLLPLWILCTYFLLSRLPLDPDIALLPRFVALWLSGTLLQLAAGLLLLLRGRSGFLPLHSPDRRQVNSLLHFALPAFAANLVQFLNYRMDLWLLNGFHTLPEWLGQYALAGTLTQMLWLLPGAAHQVLFAQQSGEQGAPDTYGKAGRTARWLLLYGMGGGLLGYLVSLWLVPLWFGPQFAQVPELIGLLLLGAAPLCGAMALSAYFAALGKIRVNLYGSILGLVLGGSCALFLIPRWHVYGAAWSSVISYLATGLFYLVLFLRSKPRSAA